MEDISSPGKIKIQRSKSKAGGVSVIIGGVLQLFSTPDITGSSSTQPVGSAQNQPTSTRSGTPKMIVIFKESSNIIVGYFGQKNL